MSNKSSGAKPKLIKKAQLPPKPLPLPEQLQSVRRNLISSLAELDRILKRDDLQNLIDNKKEMI